MLRFWAGMLLVCLLAGCGKDASIRLTRPEVEAPKTKRVHFSLTTTEAVQVSAQISWPLETIEMSSAGQRSFDAPIGDNLHVKVNVPEGFEVKDWNVVPGGNTDFDTGSPAITIKNIREDIRISAVVQRIPPKLVNTQKVSFTLDTADAGEIAVTFGDENSRRVELFKGAGQRVIDIPTGESFRAKIKMPGGWEVEKWDMSEGGEADLGTKPEVAVSNIVKDLRVTAHIRKIPMIKFKVQARGNSYFFLSHGSGAVTWAVFPPGEKPRSEWSIFSQEGRVDSFDGELRSHKVKSYPNGSTVSMKFEFVDKDNQYWYYSDTIVLDDHTLVDFDFSAVEKMSWKKGSNPYEVIGGWKKGVKVEE